MIKNVCLFAKEEALVFSSATIGSIALSTVMHARKVEDFGRLLTNPMFLQKAATPGAMVGVVFTALKITQLVASKWISPRTMDTMIPAFMVTEIIAPFALMSLIGTPVLTAFLLTIPSVILATIAKPEYAE